MPNLVVNTAGDILADIESDRYEQVAACNGHFFALVELSGDFKLVYLSEVDGPNVFAGPVTTDDAGEEVNPALSVAASMTPVSGQEGALISFGGEYLAVVAQGSPDFPDGTEVWYFQVAEDGSTTSVMTEGASVQEGAVSTYDLLTPAPLPFLRSPVRISRQAWDGWEAWPDEPPVDLLEFGPWPLPSTESQAGVFASLVEVGGADIVRLADYNGLAVIEVGEGEEATYDEVPAVATASNNGAINLFAEDFPWQALTDQHDAPLWDWGNLGGVGRFVTVSYRPFGGSAGTVFFDSRNPGPIDEMVADPYDAAQAIMTAYDPEAVNWDWAQINVWESDGVTPASDVPGNFFLTVVGNYMREVESWPEENVAPVIFERAGLATEVSPFMAPTSDSFEWPTISGWGSELWHNFVVTDWGYDVVGQEASRLDYHYIALNIHPVELITATPLIEGRPDYTRRIFS